MLGHRVRRRFEVGEQAGGGDRGQEVTASPFQPGPDQMARHPHVSHDVHLPDLVPHVLRGVLPAAGLDARVRAEQVDLAEVGARRRHHGGHALLGAGVARHGEPADLGGDPGGRRAVQIVDHEPGALGGEPAGERRADSRPGPRDDHTRVFEVHGCHLPHSSATLSTSLPRFSPRNSRSRVSGNAATPPDTTSSFDSSRPAASHSASCATPSP